MPALFQNMIDLLQIVIWGALWVLGGRWITRTAFNLSTEEEGLVGFGLGLVSEVLVFDFLARIVPITTASWLSAGLVFLVGLGLAARLQPRKLLLHLPYTPWHWLTFAVILAVFFPISQGMAIFDDFAHLPTLSTMAAGEIPPRFSLDPSVPYGYHYFLHLLAVQFMAVGKWYLWNAWDLARVISVALVIPLAVQWTLRVTGSYSAGFVSGLVVLFASGTRWLLLLLPNSLLIPISQRVQLLGSGAGSGDTLAQALINAWAIEGGGPIPLPFAFVNGLIQPGVLSVHVSTGMMSAAVTLLLLLTFNRMRSKYSSLMVAVLISSAGLLGETGLLFDLAGWGIVSLVWMLCNRSLRLPGSLQRWWVILFVAWSIIAVQGGAWTDTLVSLARKIFLGLTTVSYQTVGFQLLWPPAIVSSHLGVLPISNPLTLLTGLIEMGPLPFVLPLIAVWGWKAFKLQRWFEATLAAEVILSLACFFVGFSGSTGIRNTNRLYTFLPISLLLATPLLWWWAKHKRWAIRAALAGLGLITISSGVVLLFLQLPAIREPVYSSFITTPDVVMTKKYWDRLEKDALIFDPNPFRGVTIFGRHTDAAYTWYKFKPEFTALVEHPSPTALNSYGYSYVYIDQTYWDGLSEADRATLLDPCVKLIDEVHEGYLWRKLLDIHSCK